MAIQHEIWVSDIADNLFPEGDLMNLVTRDDQYVNFRTVHLPQSGAVPNVEKNRVVLPATITKRVDTELTYNLDEYTTDPITIGRSEEVEVSYNKRQSVLRDHLEVLRERLRNEALSVWTPGNAFAASNIILTTGANGTNNNPLGNQGRKVLRFEDLLTAGIAMDRQNIPRTSRYMLLTPTLLGELLLDPKVSNSDFTNARPLVGGEISVQVAGFTIIVINHNVVYGTSNVVKNGATVNTDSYFALAFHSQMLRAARGGIEVFDESGSPIYYGDILSALVRFGASRYRSDYKGVISIKQDANA